MKYANLLYSGRDMINMGDVLMPLSINHLYEKMGITSDEIVRINYRELSSYDGETVLLPIVSSIMGYPDGEHITCWSPAIIPVFLSLNIVSQTLSKEDIQYLKKFAPIGCRDHHTYSVMCKYDIPAYVNGCMTLTMRFREREKRKESDVLWVDVPDGLQEYIPLEYKEQKKEYSQIRTVIGKNDIEIENMIYEAYLEYIRDAKLVITSKLHCALPCIMAGIPVIFCGGEFDYRFSWLENHICYYSQKEYSKIDWHPNKNNSLFEISDKMLELAKARIFHSRYLFEYSYEMTNEIFPKSREYEICVLENMMRIIEQQIEKLYCSRKGIIRFAIWGMGQLTDMIYDRIMCSYSECVFVGMFDNKVDGKYHGIDIKKSDEIFSVPMDLIIVTPITIVGKEEEILKEKFCLHKIECVFMMDNIVELKESKSQSKKETDQSICVSG